MKKYSGPIIFATGIAMMILGIFLKETDDIMMKAIRICLECIGIG